MFRRLLFPLLVIVLLLAVPGGASSQPSKSKGPGRVDALGDPLPPGAIVRLGTTRFRHAGIFLGVAADDKALLFLTDDHLLHLDAKTGKLVRQCPLSDKQGEADGPRGLRVRAEGNPFAPALAAQGQTVAARDRSGGIVVVDAANGKILGRFTAEEINERKIDGGGETNLPLLLGGDGKLLLTGGQNKGEQPYILGHDVASKNKVFEVPGQKGGGFRTFAVGDDGNLLIALEIDAEGRGHLQLWDIAKQKKIRTVPLNDANVDQLRLLPGGKQLLAVQSAGGSIVLIDTTTGKDLRTFSEPDGPVVSYVTTSDGKKLFTAGRLGIREWEVATGKEVRHLAAGPSLRNSDRTLALSRDGKTLIVATDSAVVLLDPATGKELQPTPGHAATVTSVQFSPDGTKVLSSSLDGTARVWNAATAKELQRLNAPSPEAAGAIADSLALPAFDTLLQTYSSFSAAKDLAVVAFPFQPAQVWNVSTGKVLRALGDEKDELFVACYTQGYLGATVTVEGAVNVYDIRTGRKKSTFPAKTVGGMAGGASNPKAVGPGLAGLDLFAGGTFSPDGATLVVHSLRTDADQPPAGVTQLLEIATGKVRLNLDFGIKLGRVLQDLAPLLETEQTVVGAKYSPDGSLLALSTVSAVRLFDAGTGKELRLLGGGNVFGRAVAFSPDGKLLVAGTFDGSLRVWRVDSGQVVGHVKAHDQLVAALAFSPDGKTLASGSDDSTILLWDVAELLRDTAPVPAGAKELERLWANLGSADAGVAFQAMGQLIADPARTLALAEQHLKPVAPADPKVVNKLLADLNSPSYATRQKATLELDKLADVVQAALAERLSAKPSLEMRKRIEALLDKLEGPVTSPELLRGLRAVEVLERIATPEARQVLAAVAKGADGHRLTDAARAALARLDKRP
jgi:WD40 repeat protein